MHTGRRIATTLPEERLNANRKNHGTGFGGDRAFSRPPLGMLHRRTPAGAPNSGPARPTHARTPPDAARPPRPTGLGSNASRSPPHPHHGGLKQRPQNGDCHQFPPLELAGCTRFASSPGIFQPCAVVQLQTMAKFATLFSVILFAVGCGKSPSQKLTTLSEEFVYSSLAFSPSSATSAGLHQYQKQNLDEMLDDLSEQNLARQRTFYENFRDRLADLNTAGLTPEDRADLTILQDQIALNLLDLTEIHSHQHSPQLYVETLGNALFAPYVLEYAPKADRIRQIIARLQKVPLYLDQAATNLVSAPDVWTQVAVEENQGNINLVGQEIRAGVPPDQ